jgi:hypothetical protein
MKRRKLMFAVVLTAVVCAWPAAQMIRAQIGRVTVRSEYYRVKVVNELGEWARIGMIGYDRDANYRIELRNGASSRDNLYAGERVVVAWNRDRNLIFAAEVQINGSGTLRLQSMLPMMAEPGRKAARAAEGSSPLPRMTLEPEG